jgi:hypothetical protein
MSFTFETWIMRHSLQIVLFSNAAYKPENDLQHKDRLTGTPKKEDKGRKTKEKLTERKAFIRHHVESFPAGESKYCRAETQKTYLENELNLAKISFLYSEKCKDVQRFPLKLSL